MPVAAAAFGQRLLDHWIWLMGLWFMAEPLIDSLFGGYRDWADRYISRCVQSFMDGCYLYGICGVFLGISGSIQRNRYRQ